ncbi:MAG: ABC-2 transporter permease [Lachnospiraceae bacterium]|nr:ABC-2 transporter permease [Lachnospiraceae bacterium]
MKGLIVKDLRIAWGQKALFALMFVCAVVCILTIKDPTFIVGYLCLVSASIGTTTCAYDELNNGMAFLMTLPYSREKYVIEKYLFTLSLGFTAWVISSLLSVLYMIFTRQPFDSDFILSEIFFLIPLLLIPSIMIPIILKFGSARSRIIMLIIIGILFALGGAIALAGSTNISLARDIGNMEIASFSMKNIVSSYKIAGLGTGVSVLCFLVSMIVSMLIMKNKEY